MKMQRNKSRALFLSVAFFPLLLSAQTRSADTAAVRYEFSAKQVVEYASKNNVMVKNALLDVKIQEETNREVTAMAYPQISGSGSLTYNLKLPISLIPAEFFWWYTWNI